jgi:hypothetical protein
MGAAANDEPADKAKIAEEKRSLTSASVPLRDERAGRFSTRLSRVARSSGARPSECTQRRMFYKCWTLKYLLLSVLAAFISRLNRFPHIEHPNDNARVRPCRCASSNNGEVLGAERSEKNNTPTLSGQDAASFVSAEHAVYTINSSRCQIGDVSLNRAFRNDNAISARVP